MRGIQQRHPRRVVQPRISPAHAGNTENRARQAAGRKDQPRTCGEYREYISASWRERGSAPHMRGIPGLWIVYRFNPGISPAHAGNTVAARIRRRRGPDQPRTCGEYKISRRRPSACQGSAPHMRGILGVCSGPLTLRRISPAHAGNTIGLFMFGTFVKDQPRTCGEYFPVGVRVRVQRGSAPHMRGILRLRRRR